MRNASGFTILEIVVVLLLIGIVSAYILGRSLTTSDLDLEAQTDRIRNHIRYAQAEAMKHTDKDKDKDNPITIWGIKFTPEPGGEYWFFEGSNPDNAAKEAKLPGAEYPSGSSRLRAADLKVTWSPQVTVFFDRIGRPYSSYTDEKVNTPLALDLTLTVAAGGQTRPITITPETGFVK
jgi:MSHA pilin protein MshC